MDDPFNLNRFIAAQQDVYPRALAEIKAGRKQTHWMWYIFPQIDGLGSSSTARLYSIKNLDEARAYLEHPILGPRLREATEAAFSVQNTTAEEIFGHPDVLKLKSCATLFAQITEPDSPFHRLLRKYYSGEMDTETLRLISR